MDLSRLQSICDYYHLFFKALNWYNQILDQLSFNDAFWEAIPIKENGTRTLLYTSLLWRRQCQLLISQMPPQKPGEWTELNKLSNLFPEHQKKQGIQLAARCLLMWHIITTDSRQVRISDIQEVKSWQENRTTCSKTSTRAKSFMESCSPAHEELKMAKNTSHSLGSHYIGIRDSNPLTRQAVVEQNHCKCLPYTKLVLEEMLSAKYSGRDLSTKNITFPISNPLNLWLSLPPVSLSKPNKNIVLCQHKTETCTAHGNIPGCKTSCLVEDILLCSKSADHLVCQSDVKGKVTHRECAVQTDTLSFNDTKLCFTQKHIEKDLLFGRRDYKQLPVNPNEGITSRKWELNFSKSLEDPTDQSYDWDVKEEAKLCLIEKLLRNTEAILTAKEQELELRKEQELENMLFHTEPYCANCEAGDNCEEKTTTCEDTSYLLLESAFQSDFGSCDQGVKVFNKRCDSHGSSNNDMNLSGNVIKPRPLSGDLLHELREVYAIEKQICEESRKIQEFRDQEHTQAVEAQDTAFKRCKEKLLFLITQQRERSQVEEMEQSLAKEEAKQQRNKMKKLEMLRIKKYCQEHVKEYLTFIDPPKSMCNEAPPNKQTKEVFTEKCKLTHIPSTDRGNEQTEYSKE